MAAKLPDFVVTVARNLENETDSNVLRFAAIILENDRLLLRRLGRGHAHDEIDAVYGPFIRELVKRADELDRPRVARGNA